MHTLVAVIAIYLFVFTDMAAAILVWVTNEHLYASFSRGLPPLALVAIGSS